MVDIDYLNYILTLYTDMGINNIYIELSGGEPGIVENIDEVVEYLYNKSYIKKIDILSNGLIRKNHSNILNKYNDKVICIEHCLLNIEGTKINYFYDDITFYNNSYDNVNQVLVLDETTTNSLINNFEYYEVQGLFNLSKLWLKLITPKKNKPNDELVNKYTVLYNKIKNKSIFTDYDNLINYTKDNTKLINICSKMSLMQFIDLENKVIGQCSMDVELSELHSINKTNIENAVKGKLFDKTNCCHNCIKCGYKNIEKVYLDRRMDKLIKWNIIK